MEADFTMYELNSAIKNLKTKKSPGPDGITNEMIKHLSILAKEILLSLYNHSWKVGTFPNKWKEATIIPVAKKGKDKTSKKNYRPISLLSCLGKTMERMVNNRLQCHLEKNNLLNPAQSGFRKHRSTEDQVTYLVQEIENGFQEKKKTLSVFVDLTAAFDKVWKEGLLLKLLQKNICGNMYKWIENYLFQRTARVKLDGELSNRVKLREGVPQGGVISPTLFVIFINDITDELTKHISRALHADDLAIWTSSEQATTATVRMQTAINKISSWADTWMVTINKTKTESTMFSLSPKKETYSLKIENEELPQQETPTYLGVKLDRKLTWMPYINAMENKARKKMGIMKKLAGTKWGANNKILTQVYTGAVRPHLEYGATSFSSAAKSNTAKLDKIQNSSMRIITGAIKTTPIKAMETATNLHSLDERRREKSIRQAEKMKRIPSHPLKEKLLEPTKNRIKRQSPNHFLKSNEKELPDIVPRQCKPEPLQDYEEWTYNDIQIKLQVPNIERKGCHSEVELKTFTQEMIHNDYPQEDWTHIYTDGSAEEAVTNGGAGIYLRYPDGSTASYSVPTGKHSTNFKAESCAILHAAETVNKSNKTTENTVIFSDCKSVLESISSKSTNETIRKIKEELTNLQLRTKVILQWVPSHCGLSGNEKADRLSKEASKLEQPENSLDYNEAKTMIKTKMSNRWKKAHETEKEDNLRQLSRYEQVTIFRLRTGHCQLSSHLYKLKLCDTNECQCETSIQTVEHVLQDCPRYTKQRDTIWSEGVDLSTKLWGTAADLRRTAAFVNMTDLKI